METAPKMKKGRKLKKIKDKKVLPAATFANI